MLLERLPLEQPPIVFVAHTRRGTMTSNAYLLTHPRHIEQEIGCFGGASYTLRIV